MSNFWQRTLTGTAFVLLVVLSIFLHPLAFGLLLLAVVIMGMLELEKLFEHRTEKLQARMALFIGAGSFTAAFLGNYFQSEIRWYLALTPLVIVVFIRELYRHLEHPFRNIGFTLLVPLYVSVPFIFLQNMLFMTNGTFNVWLALIFFVMIWANDTGAYLVGVTFGKHRLFPRISPKKSWEGFIGGVVVTQLVALGVGLMFNEFNLFDAIVMALIISVMGTYGDLVESMLKRSVDQKDSGKLLPGHGGVLDRFDAIIFAAPLVCVYFEFFK
jgi:phosphatidate cytidylyltransferase